LETESGSVVERHWEMVFGWIRVFQQINNFNGYVLNVSGFSGDAGDSLNPYFAPYKALGMKIIEFWQRQRWHHRTPSSNCVLHVVAGGGWWWNYCGASGLNVLNGGYGIQTFPPDFSPQSWSVIQAVGGDNCYESNFYLRIALLSSIPTSIYTKNVFHQILGSEFWLMSLLCSVRHIFTT